MSKFLQNFIKATGPVGIYNAEEEKRRQEENASTLDKVFDTAGDIASGISNNYNWVKNTLSENLPEGVQNTLAPFGDTSPLALLFAGLSGANELEHNMEKTYAPTAAEYNYNFGKGAVSGASSVSGGIADIFGAEKTGNEFNAVTNLNKRDKEYSGADNILSLDYITNPDGLVYDAGNMVGSMAALYPSSFLAPATKVTSAAQTLKKLPFLRGLSDDALETMIRGSITSVPESLSEGGNVVRQAKEEGLDDPYLRGWKTAGLNLPALAISNGLEYGLLGGKIFKPAGKVGESVPERMVKGVYRSIPATVATSAQQGLEEYVQQGISNAQTDKEWGLLPWNASQDQIDSLLIGALTGAPMSGAASYTRSITNQRPEQEANTGNKDIDSYINEASVTYGIPTNIIQAQMQAESNFDQNAVSGAGAIGLMQLMPGTAEELGVDPNDPRQNVMGGVKYLKQMYDATGNWRDALIAYNEGLGAWQEGHRYAESVAYADKILNNLDGDIKAPTSSSIDDITINFTNDILNSTFNDDGSMRGANEDAYNFFKDKTVKDSNGNFRFNATDENITALNKKYGEQIQSYRYKNNETQDNLTLNSTNNINKRGNENINATNNNVNINMPNLNKLREFARQRIKTSRNPAEINDLQSLFKNNNEDSQFLDDNVAKNFILRNYGNEYNNFVNNNKKQENKITNYEEVKQSELDSNLVKNINSYRQAVNSGFNRSKNKQNSLSPLSLIFSRDSIQKAQDIVRKLDDNKLQNRFSNLFGNFNENTLNPSTVGGNIAENEVINGTNIPEVEQAELMQGIFDDLKNKQKIDENVQNLLQQQVTQEALYQQQLQQQHVPYKTYQEKKRREVEQQYANDIYNDTEVPASVGTQARKTENRGRTKANKDILDKFRTTENPILKQGYIDKLAENISNMFSSGYSAKNNKGSLKKLSDFINAESRRNEFLKQLTEEEQNVLMYLDYTFENTGKAFKDVLQEAENERKKIIDRYKDILRSQMKQGVTPRSVAYNRETGEYINSPGYSNNYQWYRDMTANGTRSIGKKELEDNLDYIAVEHLTDGYFDPQYGWQIPGGGDEQFHEMEDTINVLNSIATKAEAYEAERFIPTKNKRGVASNKGNVQQTKQSEKIDLIGLKAVTQGLLNRLSEAKENGELQNPSSVNIKKVEKDINSDNYTKQKKAIDFVGNKLDEALPIEEKQSIKENISRTISNTSETNTIIEQNKNNEQAKEVVNEEISKQPDKVEEKQNDNKITKEKKSKPIEEKPQKQTSFVDVKTAEDDLLKAFGLKRANTEKHKQKKRVKIVDDSDNALEAEWDKLNKALDNLSANPLFNPEVVVPLFKIGMIYAQRGINNFANFSERMIEKGGERIKPWIKPAWNMTASYQGDDLDENKLAAAFQYVGSKWENGTKSLDKIKSDFEELVGNEQAEPYMQYIEVAHKGAQAYFNPDIPVVQLKENDNIEVKENVDGSTSKNTERDSEGNNKNPVGADNESEGSIRGNGEENNGQTSQDRKGQRSIRVQSSSSDTSRTTSDSTVRKESSTNTNGSTRNINLPGSIRDSYERSTVSDEGRTEPIDKPSEERQLNEGNLLKQDKAISKEKASRLDDIKHDLPILLPEQQGDVLFAEERLIENKKPGVMFTNGTGTGKTYTGLGILKRFVNQGKKNILIVTPSNDINKAWIDAAKKDFDIKITPLENTNDIGKDVVVTTYANMGYNNNLVNREWDLILCDESHRLMSSEQAKVTASLNNLRALTYNHNGLYERFQRLRAEEYKTVDDYAQKIKAGEATEKEEKARQDLIDKLSKEREELFKQWQEIKEEDKPKVVFLSATPFSYVPNVDYAEGYLFNYDEDKEGFRSYNQPSPYEDFFIKHFGYRMRYNKLTKPDADVNTALMEIEFHKFLEDSGALSGRILTTSKDYDRGFILVDSGVGAKIDEGIQFLWDNNKKYDLLLDRVRNKLKGNKTRYILEAIKAKSAIDLVKEYLKGNKKVVIFHDFKKNEASNPFVLTKEDFIYVDDEGKSGYSKEAMEQYELFKRERPDLLNLNLKDLTSPINRFIEAFGDKVGIYNGSVDKKTRSNMIKEFNKDNDGLDVILIQRASGKEGISLHDRTGKKQRVLIDLGLPTRPTDAIQCEGRIYRVGVKTNAIFRYLNTGTNTEAYIFSSVIAERSSTAENLALGEKARNLKESFIETFEESKDSDSWKKYLPNSKTEGTGGVQRDRQQQLNITPFERAKSYYYANQKKTSKNKAREGIDYYPTPEPIGYKMVEFADIKSGDSVLEPSAGHGAIARFFPEDTKNVAIEPSSELANTIRLRFNKNGRVIESTFENYDVHNKFNEIVMNPPYGTAAKTAMEHLEKAFNHLRDGGRIVALLPAGNSMGKRFENAKLIIRPKKFDFNEVGIDEEYYAEMVGDGAYKKINERIANEFDMSIDDVEQLLNKKGDNKNKVRRSSKHRFFGNIQHRTGAKGYEDKDLNWVLRHYFNSACRYEALETEFKPKAISYFERIYGRIGTDNKYLNGTARYIKDYINDVNGNPSALENSISTWLNNRRLWRYLFTSRYGERAALSVAGNITNKISILKLGVWNVSSAMLNLTQLLNTTALLTDKSPVKAASEVSKAMKDVAALTEGQTEKRIAKLKPDERKAMEDTGVLHELGLDSGAGYSKTSFGKWGDRSMILFKASERLARCATILAAYRKARNVLNKNHDDAVKYARDINRRANFDYGVNDAPNVFRRGSIISQVLFQFMKYPIKQFELMRDFIPFNGKKDATWQQKTTFWGGWIFFAGAFGLPAEDLLWALVGLISEPVFGVSPKQAVRQFLLEASKDASLPERLAIRTLLYGGLSNVGIDISSRVGMNDIIPGLGEDYNKDANPVIKAMEKFGGATGGTIAQFYLNATKGDNLGMLRSISPGMYNIYTAAIGESKDGRGRITTKYDDAMSRIIRGMGFKSTNEAIDTELGSLKYYNMKKKAEERQNAIDDYLDAEERKENLAPYIKKLNELGVKRSTIVKARKDRKKDRRERLKEKDTPEYYQGAEALSW